MERKLISVLPNRTARDSGEVSVATLEEILEIEEQPAPLDAEKLDKLLKRRLDTGNFKHTLNVAVLARELSRQYGVSDPESEELKGRYHDIGKTDDRMAFLPEPRRLTEAERGIMEEHPVIGYKILKAAGLPEQIADAVLAHHYLTDGYPSVQQIFELTGKNVEEILPSATCLTVADQVDSMVNPRYPPEIAPHLIKGKLHIKLQRIPRSQDMVYRALKIITDPEYERKVNDYAKTFPQNGIPAKLSSIGADK